MGWLQDLISCKSWVERWRADLVLDTGEHIAKVDRFAQHRYRWFFTTNTEIHTQSGSAGIGVDPRPQVFTAIQLRDVAHFCCSLTIARPVGVHSDVVRIKVIAKWGSE